MHLHPSASLSVTLRIESHGVPGALARVTSAIGASGGVIVDIEFISTSGRRIVPNISVVAYDQTHQRSIVERVGTVDDIAILDVSTGPWVPSGVATWKPAASSRPLRAGDEKAARHVVAVVVGPSAPL